MVIFDDKTITTKEIFDLLCDMESCITDTYPSRNVFHVDLRNEDLEKKSLENTVSITKRDDNGRLIGFLKLLTDHSYMFYILDVMVHPDHRNKGIGNELIECAVTYGKENGFIKIFLTSLPDKVGFYEKFGFKQGMSPVLSLRGEDYV